MKDRGAGSWLRPVVVMTVTIVLANAEAVAGSGPGTAEAIRQSQRIALTLAAFSFLVIAAGTIPLALQGKVGTLIAFWWIATLHPGLWIGLTHGDWGYEARVCSLAATTLYSLTVALATAWPGSGTGKAKKRRAAISGGLAGGIAGTLLVVLELATHLSLSADTILVAGWSFVSVVAAGAMCGARLCSVHDGPWYRPQFRARTLMLMPAIVAPLLVIVLPIRRYHSFSTTSPYSFVVVDEETRQPIPNATVSLVDPRNPSPPDIRHDRMILGWRLTCSFSREMYMVTGADGRGEIDLRARVTVRKGLLGRTETVSFDPCTVRVEAAGYALCLAPLSIDTSTRTSVCAAGSFGSNLPTPPAAVIGLIPKTAGTSPGSRVQR